MFAGRAALAGISRKLETTFFWQRVQGPRGSWSIQVKLGRCLKGSEINIYLIKNPFPHAFIRHGFSACPSSSWNWLA